MPPSDERIDALDAIDGNSGSSDLVTDFDHCRFLTGMMTGVGAPPDVVEQLRAHRKDMKAQMQNNVELSMSVTYHGVTRVDLQQYAKELASPAHRRRFYAQVSRTFVEITQERRTGNWPGLEKGHGGQKELAAEEIFNRLLHHFAARVGDCLGEWNVLGADLNAVLGKAALLNATITH